jgi:hypothetical protein
MSGVRARRITSERRRASRAFGAFPAAARRYIRLLTSLCESKAEMALGSAGLIACATQGAVRLLTRGTVSGITIERLESSLVLPQPGTGVNAAMS